MDHAHRRQTRGIGTIYPHPNEVVPALTKPGISQSMMELDLPSLPYRKYLNYQFKSYYFMDFVL
jgi:hypothetical protein